MSIEIQRSGYLELASLCINSNKNEEFKSFVKDLNDYNDHPDYMTTLNFVIEHLYKNSYSFIICLDWKQAVSEFNLNVDNSLSKHFGLTMDLPKQEDYGPRASVSYENVFKDFDAALNAHGFQLSFLDTDSDEYMVVVHKIADLEKVKSAVGKIGYDCLNAHSRKISG